MRRPWWTRLAAAVLGIWLVLVLGEPGLVHVCPEHDGVAMHRVAMHGGGNQAPHRMGTMRHADHGHQAPPHEHQGGTCVGCCVGCCVGVTAVALLGRAPTTVFGVEVPFVAATQAPVGLLPRPGPAYSRPYTTGPPRA